MYRRRTCLIIAALMLGISAAGSGGADRLPASAAVAAMRPLNELSGEAEQLAEAGGARWLAAMFGEGAVCVAIDASGGGGEMEVELRFRSLAPKPGAGDMADVLRPALNYDVPIALRATVKPNLPLAVYGCADKPGQSRPPEIDYAVDAASLVAKLAPYADSAQAQFDDPNTRIAISNALLPCPVEDVSSADAVLAQLTTHEYSAEFEAIACDVEHEIQMPLALLMLAQRSQVLNVANGPDALVLKCVGAEPVDFVLRAIEAVELELRQTPFSNSMPEPRIRGMMLNELVESALKIRSGQSGGEYSLELNAFELMSGESGDAYCGYVNSFKVAYTEGTARLISAVRALPDYPEQPFPDTGVVNAVPAGEHESRACLISPDDEYARFVKLHGGRDISCFIRPGETCMFTLPVGTYEMTIASGTHWYGEELLFGEDTAYVRTASIEIGGNEYFYRFTLSADTAGNIASWPITSEEFS